MLQINGINLEKKDLWLFCRNWHVEPGGWISASWACVNKQRDEPTANPVVPKGV